jgi:hypothetical protein
MRPIHRKRLFTLAKFLETKVPRKRFNMDSWCTQHEWGTTGRPFDKNDCHMSACAGGWATTIPYFRAAGLRSNEIGEPVFHGGVGFNAMTAFFDLPYRDAVALFTPNKDHETPKQVAKRIRTYLASVSLLAS